MKKSRQCFNCNAKQNEETDKGVISVIGNGEDRLL